MAKQDMDIEADTIAKDESPSSAEAMEGTARVYELGFHLDPELPTEEVKKAYQAILELITSKSTIVALSEPEKIQLSYTISRQGASDSPGRRDFDSAYFSWIVYETSAENHADVLTAANADKRIIRFIDLITTKDAARHSIEVRELSLKTPERTKESETVIGAELDAAIEHVTI
jgi:ribosomal protein S6